MRVSGEGGRQDFHPLCLRPPEIFMCVGACACGLAQYYMLAAYWCCYLLAALSYCMCLRPSACGLCLFFLKTGSRELLLAALRFCVVLLGERGLRPLRLGSLGWAQVGILFELIGVQVLSNSQNDITCIYIVIFSISVPEFVGLDISL